MILGIEIGGTKLQLGVGSGAGPELAAVERFEVDARRGAAGILEQIAQGAAALAARFPFSRIGIGFGGPVDAARGRVVKSHQISGWEGVELGAWCRQRLGLTPVLGNDCDVAALAEARYGAGRGKGSVFYVTVGTGVGGGFVCGGRSHGGTRPAVAEIGHLRPGPAADWPEATVESLASGLGLANMARSRVFGEPSRVLPLVGNPSVAELARVQAAPPDRAVAELARVQAATETDDRDDLRQRAGGQAERLNARLLAEAAAAGNGLAESILRDGCRILGWAIAQMITLLAPEVVVVGGGVSLMGEALFFAPLRESVRRYVFPPLVDSYTIVPAALGELVVVHGAIALAATAAGP